MTEVLGTGTTSTPAVKGVNTGTDPDQGRGVWGESDEHDGVAGYSSATGRFSGYFKNLEDGWGVFSDTSGDSRVSLWGAASGEDGGAVLGTAIGDGGYGVIASASPGYWALYSIGALNVDGGAIVVDQGPYLAAGGFLGDFSVLGDFEVETGYWKSFIMDHPLDPANRLLRHVCIESPEPKNLYEGVSTADGNGEILVQLPAYFESINTELRYLLTPLGRPAPNLRVKQEFRNDHFVIAGAQPHQKVSWQVMGIRSDAASRLRPFVAEEDKAPTERGRYYAPEAHGQPREKRLMKSRFPTPSPFRSTRPKDSR